MPAPIYIGIDAGGSKTELQAEAGNSTFRQIGDGVNFQRDGAARSTDVFSLLIAEAFEALEHDGTGSICLGVAGTGRLEDRLSLAEHLRQRFGASLGSYVFTVEHDAHIALEAAFEGESGMLVIAGTGSIVLARTTANALERAGGWGPRVGDDGSGTAIGMAGLSAVAASFDGGEPTTLSTYLATELGITSPEGLIHTVYTDTWTVQALAPLVVAAAEEGDSVCERILTTQADALSQRARWLVARAHDITPRVALMGGIASEAHYGACLTEALRRHLPGWQVVHPSCRPVDGALSLARKLGPENRDQEIDSGG